MVNKLIRGLTALVGIPILAGALGSYTNEAQGSLAPSPYNVIKARCENNKYHTLIRNPDGSVSQSTLVHSPDGKFLREYKRPYPDKRLDKKPGFHSTGPRLTYPDGTLEGYRPRMEGETTQDVLKECPVDKYVPKNPQKNDSKTNPNTDKPKADKDGWMPAKD